MYILVEDIDIIEIICKLVTNQYRGKIKQISVQKAMGRGGIGTYVVIRAGV